MRMLAMVHSGEFVMTRQAVDRIGDQIAPGFAPAFVAGGRLGFGTVNHSGPRRAPGGMRLRNHGRSTRIILQSAGAPEIFEKPGQRSGGLRRRLSAPGSDTAVRAL